MYIADNGNKRILKWSIGQNQGRIANGANGSRVPLNQISQCFGIYVDAQSNLYVSDNGNHRVVIWDGRNTTNGRLVAGGNGFGTAENQLHSPYGIYVDKKVVRIKYMHDKCCSINFNQFDRLRTNEEIKKVVLSGQMVQ
ncbi:unnamed protein product [Rotaria socialis]|uniref:Uncharacterized protein n=1 Tax=Rotaria socialis TaxID=392032 RepID=A0A818AV47_9BILA|nr:unnamed protein product [Rotaria socialis]